MAQSVPHEAISGRSSTDCAIREPREKAVSTSARQRYSRSGRVLLTIGSLAGTTLLWIAARGQAMPARNSVGMELKPISAGSFTMGADEEALPASVTAGYGVMSQRPAHGDFDETPRHGVKLTYGFSIAATEVTVEQFRQYDPEYQPNPACPNYAAGVSWHQA